MDLGTQRIKTETGTTDNEALDPQGTTQSSQSHDPTKGQTNKRTDPRDPSAVLNDCRPEIEELFHQGYKTEDIMNIVKARHGINIT